MKIAILTLPLQSNYGGILQAFALIKSINNLGHETYLINIKHKEKSYIQKILLYFFRLLKLLTGKKTILFMEREFKISSNILNKFVSNHIPQTTDPCFTTKDLKLTIKKHKFNAIVVGSDQVWRPAYSPNIYNYFLNFIGDENVLRISYAASFGTDGLEYKKPQLLKCKKLLKKFNAISVRENTGVEIINKYFESNAHHVLDPTLLLNPSIYESLANNSDSKSLQKGIFVYVLDNTELTNNTIKISENILKCKSYKISTRFENNNVSLEYRISSTIEDWLCCFKQSDFVITDSYHGMIFSIIFKKQFIVLGNKSRGMSRFTSLLRIFNLENRIITDSNFLDRILNTHIDYHKINNTLNYYREKSLFFLQNSFQNQDKQQ